MSESPWLRSRGRPWPSETLSGQRCSTACCRCRWIARKPVLTVELFAGSCQVEIIALRTHGPWSFVSCVRRVLAGLSWISIATLNTKFSIHEMICNFWMEDAMWCMVM